MVELISKVSFTIFVMTLFQYSMQKQLFKTLAKINKLVLPSFSKRQLDLSKASKFQLAIIGWRSFVTKNALD